ncbi:MAG: hypothetical protein HY292_27770 [Planctomycetes bacterium]|nr:hypothetical protein [Planctomycetota bacterium]
MLYRSVGVLIATSLLTLTGPRPATAEPPIWEGRIGTPLGLTDDSTYETTFGAQLFTFKFEGATYSGASVLSISSNGFLSLGGSNGDGCCSPNPINLVSGFPRIAPLWVDLIPNGTGDVYLNTFNDSAGPFNDRLVITWATVTFLNRLPVLFQVQLKSDGTIIFGYDRYDFTGNADNVIVGVSPSNGAADPGSLDLSASIPFHSDARSTIYELFSAPSPAVDLDQTNIVFSPNNFGGFRVTRQLCRPPIWQDGYGLPLHLADDGTYETTFGAWNFVFPFRLDTYVGASPLSVSANGFVSLGGSNGNDCCSGNPAVLVGDPFPRIAALWQDLNPTFAGEVFMNAYDDDGDAVNDRLVVTWDTVFFQNRKPVAVQLQLRKDGSFSLGWQCVFGTGLVSDILVGVSPGGGAPDPGPVDFSAAIPFSSNGESTLYEVYPQMNPGSPPFDLSGKNLVFERSGSGGFVVTSAGCQPPIWESRFGADLGLTDDSDVTVPISTYGFTFPFGGTTYSGSSLISISSNGFVTLGGTNGNGCCSAIELDFLSALPRIAPLWVDLLPRGHIYVHPFDDWGGPETDRLVITWDTVFFQNRQPATIQLQLLSTGTMVMSYRCLDLDGSGLGDALTGITPGSGAGHLGSTDLSRAVPFDSFGERTIYEFFPGPRSIDLAGKSLVFEPSGGGGYHVGTIECAAGTVNASPAVLGTRDVLRANGSAGSPVARVVTVARSTPITVSLSAAPEGPAANALYALWVWSGSTFHPSEYRPSRNRIGCFVNPIPLMLPSQPQPILCLQSPTLPTALCRGVHTMTGPAFAPWSLTLTPGFSRRTRLTIQGLLKDNGGANVSRLSATNAIVIDVP